MIGNVPSPWMNDTARSIWSKVFSMLDGMTKMSPASHRVISSSRSIPKSGLYQSYRAEILRTAWGPKRAPLR